MQRIRCIHGFGSICHYILDHLLLPVHTYQPISRNTLSESRNLNSFLPASDSTLVAVARESVLSRCSAYPRPHRLRWRSLSRNRYRACSFASARRNFKPNGVPTDVVDCRTELSGCSRSGLANGEVSATAQSRCGTVSSPCSHFWQRGSRSLLEDRPIGSDDPGRARGV